jgi:hypothetical protein
MSMLRLLLVLWLSLSVPMAALASVVRVEHCQRGATTSSATMVGHAQHVLHAGMQMAGDHAGHMARAARSGESSADGCACGCNCGNAHCASSGAGCMAVGGLKGAPSVSADSKWFAGDTTLLVTAPPLDLLRPPTLI